MASNKPTTLNDGNFIAKAINSWHVFCMLNHIFMQTLSYTKGHAWTS